MLTKYYGNKDSEINYFLFVGILILFLLLAFDRDLALIYIAILIVDKWWFDNDKQLSFPITKGRFSNFKVYSESLAALGAFLLISTLLTKVFSPQSLINSDGVVGGAQSIFHLLATSTPILQGSIFLTFIGWGLVVPFIETSFFNGRLLEGFATKWEYFTGQKVTLSLNKTMFIVIGVVATIFTLFHITAKGLDSIPLMITFIFSVISSVLVIRHKELKGAILLHVVTNTLAVASSFGFI